MEQTEQTIPQPKPFYTRKDDFLAEFGNEDFRFSKMIYVSFGIIFLFIGQSFYGDTTGIFENMNEAVRLLTYISTIVALWIMYGIIYFSVVRENTFVKGIGLVKLRVLDFARGIALLLTLFVLAPILTVGMAQLGYVSPGAVEMFLPQELFGKLMWIVMSFTAGFCEEAVFRGYLLTRIRLLGNFSSWTMPVIISSLLFGIPHLYQGIAGGVIITILGAVFAYSYIRYRTLWPAIIAHFFFDFIQLFVPWFESNYDRIFG